MIGVLAGPGPADGPACALSARCLSSGGVTARTAAGVHYEQDNYAGLNLGKLVMLEKLPNMLYETYGVDPVKVRDRLEYLRFDWEDFDPK